MCQYLIPNFPLHDYPNMICSVGKASEEQEKKKKRSGLKDLIARQDWDGKIKSHKSNSLQNQISPGLNPLIFFKEIEWIDE